MFPNSIMSSFIRGIFLFLFWNSIVFVLNAQYSVNTAGVNSVANEEGEVSYSVGQIDQSFVFNSSWSVTEGVQQPFDFVDVTTVGYSEFVKENISIMVSPNPTHDVFYVQFSLPEEHYTYSLNDMYGKFLFDGDLIDGIGISISAYPNGVYFFRVKKSGKNDLVTFKILKY